MNKRLEQMFNEYYYRNYAYITSQADTKDIVKSIARHFYNLALADMRGEVEGRVKSIESCPFIEAEFGAEKKREGKIQAYKNILDFINDLTK